MTTGETGDLVGGGEYEVNSHRAHLSAYVLIAGLILELVNSIVWYRGSETLAGMVAVLLIVGGVWGEVFFANRARLAGDRQLAEYQARAAEALQKAREAELELARLKAPRALTQEQRARIVGKLQQFSGTEYDITVSDVDPEILGFVFAVELVLSTSGWTELDWQGTGETFIRQGQPLICISRDSI